MSYDIHLEIDTGGPEYAMVEDVGNYTWNCGAMFANAIGCGLGELDGQNAGEWSNKLAAGVAHMLANPSIYLPMNPENGWGDYESATQYLSKLASACARHPKARIRVY